MFSRLLIVVLGIVLFSTTSMVSAASPSLGVSPMKQVMQGQPGEQLNFTLEAINDNQYPITVEARVMDTNGADEYGNPRLMPVNPENKWSLANWVEIPEGVTELPTGVGTPMNFSFTIPSDAPNGGYYAIIVLSPVLASTPSEGEVQLVGEVGIPILLTVGDIPPLSAEIMSFDVDMDGLRDGFPVHFRLRIKNNSRTHILPQGVLTLSREDTSLEEIYRDKDEDGNLQLVNTIPLNASNGYVLPNSTRTFIIPWRDNVEYGDIQATYSLDFGNGNKQSNTVIIPMDKRLTIDQFSYDTSKRGFDVTLHNLGNVQMPLRGQIAIYTTAGRELYDRLEYPPDSSDVEWLTPGEERSIFLPWASKESPDSDVTIKDERYGIFFYILDGDTGETQTAKTSVFVEGEYEVDPMKGQVPYMILIAFLVGVIGLLLLRGAKVSD